MRVQHSLPLDDSLAVLAVVFGSVYLTWGVLHALRRRRPQFSVSTPVAVGFSLRVLAALAVSTSSSGASLRGPDEETWLRRAEELLSHNLFSVESLDLLTSQLHVWLFSAQLRADLPVACLRITQVAIATVGLLLLAAAVYDLAGPRAATTASWLLAFEPASIFFSGVLHKEALMLGAIGLVSFGSVRLWRDGSAKGMISALAGCFIAVATRPYAGWFLVAALMALVLHGAIRREARDERRRPARVLLGILASVVVFVSIPTLMSVSSRSSLQVLQASQDANLTRGANLTLDPIDYSDRISVFRNLPRRASDVVLRPYPWQVSNLSQQLGLIGTVVALVALFCLLGSLVASIGDIARRSAPLMYPCVFLLAAYALSAGNAGTSFRYRTQLIALAICIVVTLRASPRSARTRRPFSWPSRAT
jgi:hypothetical protein